MKRLITAIALGSTVVVISAFMLSSTASTGYVTDDTYSINRTLALAPISLGNPAAAHRGLEIESPDTPIDYAAIGKPTYVAVQQSFKAKRGDTLAGLLGRAGATGKDVAAAMTAMKSHFNPRQFRQGQVVKVSYRSDTNSVISESAAPGVFHGFSLLPDPTTELKVARAIDGKFKAWKLERQLTTRATRSEGEIRSSLYVAGKKAGLTNSVLAELIRAYSWDVDFQRDIRKGDHFEVMFDKVIDEDGKIIKSDVIHYASLTLSGKANRIYRFKTKDGHTGYYNEKGHSAQKALMRTPIDGARLSSGFGRRKHPVLGYTKLHKGVDFAAPRGTPIYAAGNGTITYAGRKGSFGKYIRIRHNGTYATAYAHMKGIRKGIRKGTRVSQGQIIGYVGTTGRSTGPHLHYEIFKNNRQANPMRIKMPSGEKLKSDQLAKFMVTKDRVDDQYASLPSASQQTASANR